MGVPCDESETHIEGDEECSTKETSSQNLRISQEMPRKERDACAETLPCGEDEEEHEAEHYHGNHRCIAPSSSGRFRQTEWKEDQGEGCDK